MFQRTKLIYITCKTHPFQHLAMITVGVEGKDVEFIIKKISLLLFLYGRGTGEDNLFKQEF